MGWMTGWDSGDFLPDTGSVEDRRRGFVPGFVSGGCLWTLIVMVLTAVALGAWAYYFFWKSA